MYCINMELFFPQKFYTTYVSKKVLRKPIKKFAETMSVMDMKKAKKHIIANYR